jgi:hypothetical protein
MTDTPKKPQNEKEKQRIAAKKRLRNSFIRVANTEAGRDVIRYLMAQCGFHTPSINVDPQTTKILTDNTVYNEARRNLYLDLRKWIPPKMLVKIEFNLEAAPEDEDDEDE